MSRHLLPESARIRHADGSEVDPVELEGLSAHIASGPDPIRCDDPWCPSAPQGVHLHGFNPTLGRRV